ncbi:oligosaccharide flippase family protein, partial [Intestinibacillus massiliensis]|uniref:oligosaccharide flippase family protein n=1 Tax=Intestinibacillus massiliensis TaxID=1871029 RepID=UPI001356331A
MHRKKQNFVQGAFILLVANLIVKVIGALFQIPLTRMVGVANMGLFNTAYTIYMVMLVVSSVGLPSSLAKMVAEATALGREREVRRIVRVAACIFVPFGAVCTLLLFFGAGVLAERVGNPGAAAAVAAISPSVLMVSTLSVFRGYYQGRSDMVPTAVSQIIEALGQLLLRLGVSGVALGGGAGRPAVAAGLV